MADVGDQGARQLLVRRREGVAAIVNEALALDLDQRSDLGRIDT
jgi:CTP:molybdopterin cytidylyltransferase MocA